MKYKIFLCCFLAAPRRPTVLGTRGWHLVKALDEADLAVLVSCPYLARVSRESVRYGDFFGRKGDIMQNKGLRLLFELGNGLGCGVDVAWALALMFSALWLPLVVEWLRKPDLTRTPLT